MVDLEIDQLIHEFATWVHLGLRDTAQTPNTDHRQTRNSNWLPLMPDTPTQVSPPQLPGGVIVPPPKFNFVDYPASFAIELTVFGS